MAEMVKRRVELLFATYLNKAGQYVDAPRGAEVYVHPDDVERFDRLNKPNDPISEQEYALAADSVDAPDVDPENLGRRGPVIPSAEKPKGKGV